MRFFKYLIGASIEAVSMDILYYFMKIESPDFIYKAAIVVIVAVVATEVGK